MYLTNEAMFVIFLIAAGLFAAAIAIICISIGETLALVRKEKRPAKTIWLRNALNVNCCLAWGAVFTFLFPLGIPLIMIPICISMASLSELNNLGSSNYY